MTVGGIIGCVCLSVVLLAIGIAVAYWCFEENRNALVAITIFFMIIFIFFTWFGFYWYYNNTEAGKRAIKTQESNFDGGITREVKVYDVEGDLIQEYKGKFDIDYDDDRIIFDDEKGNRHIIYYPTGTVVIDEVDE